MTVLLRDALAPNLVQTLEHAPAFVHGGPFANIAHGCSSVMATRAGLRLAEYVVTEAGFGADLGAEKFLDIKCRKTGLRPSAAVIVATMRALKYHGGVDVKEVSKENVAALEKGLVNLERHVENVAKVYGIPCVVSINKFTFDTDAELKVVTERMKKLGVQVVLANHWAEGGKGAAELAKIVVGLCDQPSQPSFVYEDADPLWEKINKIAKKVYRASEVTADAKVRGQIKKLQEDGYGHFPVCVAKTQSSFSTDAALRGAPSNHVVNVREVRLAAGAEFVVMICGDIMTMPGLPKVPSAEKIDLIDGKVVGLF
jgi:formate--tetrahydrofolate ligase